MLYFLVAALVGFPFYLLCVILGGACEIIFGILIGLFLLGRVALIVLACVFAGSETFISIPFVKQLILKFAN